MPRRTERPLLTRSCVGSIQFTPLLTSWVSSRASLIGDIWGLSGDGREKEFRASCYPEFVHEHADWSSHRHWRTINGGTYGHKSNQRQACRFICGFGLGLLCSCSGSEL